MELRRYGTGLRLLPAALLVGPLSITRRSPQFYTLSNNTARRETVEEARAIDGALKNAWRGHRHHRIIGNDGDFAVKVKVRHRRRSRPTALLW